MTIATVFTTTTTNDSFTATGVADPTTFGGTQVSASIVLPTIDENTWPLHNATAGDAANTRMHYWDSATPGVESNYDRAGGGQGRPVSAPTTRCGTATSTARQPSAPSWVSVGSPARRRALPHGVHAIRSVAGRQRCVPLLVDQRVPDPDQRRAQHCRRRSLVDRRDCQNADGALRWRAAVRGHRTHCEQRHRRTVRAQELDRHCMDIAQRPERGLLSVRRLRLLGGRAVQAIASPDRRHVCSVRLQPDSSQHRLDEPGPRQRIHGDCCSGGTTSAR